MTILTEHPSRPGWPAPARSPVAALLLAVAATFAIVAALAPDPAPGDGASAGAGGLVVEEWHGNSASIRPAG